MKSSAQKYSEAFETAGPAAAFATVGPIQSPAVIPVVFGEATAQRWIRIHTRPVRSMSPERKAICWLAAGQVVIILTVVIMHLVEVN